METKTFTLQMQENASIFLKGTRDSSTRLREIFSMTLCWQRTVCKRLF